MYLTPYFSLRLFSLQFFSLCFASFNFRFEPKMNGTLYLENSLFVAVNAVKNS